jgi:hypothetical protein
LPWLEAQTTLPHTVPWLEARTTLPHTIPSLEARTTLSCTVPWLEARTTLPLTFPWLQAHSDVFLAVQNGDLEDAGEFLNQCGKRRRVPAGSPTIAAASRGRGRRGRGKVRGGCVFEPVKSMPKQKSKVARKVKAGEFLNQCRKLHSVPAGSSTIAAASCGRGRRGRGKVRGG